MDLFDFFTNFLRLWQYSGILSSNLCFKHNPVMLIFLITDLSWSFGAVFVSCELCQRAIDAHYKIADDVGQLSWYSFPFEMWKSLPLIILNAQQETEIRCFGSILCVRETFKAVSM